MTFFINAWLEREDPVLELRESITNRMVFHIEGEVLTDWLEKGELSVNDLNNVEDSHEVVKDLLLKSITVAEYAKPFYRKPQSNVIKFPLRYRKSNLSLHGKLRKKDNVIYLHSILSRRILKYLDNAIY